MPERIYMDSLQLAKKIAGILDDKKAIDINVIRIEEISSLADYFVIASGTSNTHVKSLADEIEMKIKQETGSMPIGVEGYRTNSWILIDYVSVVVHVFTGEGRDFYDLDRLWRDGEKIEIDLKPTSSI